MKNLFKQNALEHLLRSKWSTFIDKTKLLAYVLQSVRDANLPVVSRTTVKRQTGYKVTVSRLELLDSGLLLWVDYDVPTDEHCRCIGTSEIILTNKGSLQSGNTIGQVYKID